MSCGGEHDQWVFYPFPNEEIETKSRRTWSLCREGAGRFESPSLEVGWKKER